MRTGRLLFSLVMFYFLSVSTSIGQGSAPWEYWRNTQTPITDFNTVNSAITITDAFTIANMAVMVDIQHTSARDLAITLTGPTGTYVLSQYNGGVYDNYENTLFDFSTGYPGFNINDPLPSAYFRGVYKPQAPSFPTSGSATGTWTLSVYDNAVGDQGTLRKWGLIFNRYGQYKDVRWGADVNSLGGIYPPPYVGDFTTSSQGLRPYSVYGYRPQANGMLTIMAYQNSKIASVTKFTFQEYMPNSEMPPAFSFEGSVPAMSASPGAIFHTIPSAPGTFRLQADLYQRTDLFMTRSDNSYMHAVPVTAGSLGYDAGPATGTFNLSANECFASVFDIAQSQVLTSVDVWQGSSVELEPMASPARVSVRVYNAPSGIPSGVPVATTGLVPFPKQGSKWVTYAFTPPVTLPGGTYGFAFCTDVNPTTGGTGVGVDQLGSPFDPDGVFSKYSIHGVEYYTLNNGTLWLNENLRVAGGRKMRPNFVLGSDVGVISIDNPPTSTLPGSFTPQVTFGSFAHHPNLPNLITVGKVTIRNSGGQQVYYSERRVFLQQAPFMVTTSFDNVSGLQSGTYTITAEIVRSDDENLVNNSYTRTYTMPFAPIIISHSGIMSAQLQSQILNNATELGLNVEFVDRATSGNPLPQSGEVIWVGDMTKVEAIAARTFAEKGGKFSVLTSNMNTEKVLTNVYATLSNTEEALVMNRVIHGAENAPELNIDQHNQVLANMGGVFLLQKDPSQQEKYANMIEESFAQLKTRLNLIAGLPQMQRSMDGLVYNQSSELRIEAERFGDLSLAQVVISKSTPQAPVVNPITNPASFELTQNYPNPFNPTTNIAYNVPADAQVSIRVYDILGRMVATLANSLHQAGQYIVTWDGQNDKNESVASGIYLYRFEASPFDGSAPFAVSKKMVLSR